MDISTHAYLEESLGGVQLRHPAVVHDQDAIRVHDGVEPVSDGEHRAVAECRSARVETMGMGMGMNMDQRDNTRQCSDAGTTTLHTHVYIGYRKCTRDTSLTK